MKGLKEYIVSSWNKFQTKCVNKFKGRPHSTSGYKYRGEGCVRVQKNLGSLPLSYKLKLPTDKQIPSLV
jgi:hypothetical protein